LDLNTFHKKAAQLRPDNEKFFKRLKQKPPKDLDEKFHAIHEDVFDEIDCLSCANCCKTTSPIFYERDIERAANALRMNPGDFVEKYLKMDEDGDSVLKSSPCAFLDADNYCTIYEHRPNACREYPHTNRKKMHQIMDLTFKNTMVCPAVLEMTERLKKILK